MRNIIICLFLLSGLFCRGAVYKHIEINREGNKQKVYAICQDSKGYLWFLTSVGLERYDGKELHHYGFGEEFQERNFKGEGSKLYAGTNGKIWIQTKEGLLLYFDFAKDCYKLITDLKNRYGNPPDFTYRDHRDNLWIACKNKFILYKLNEGEVYSVYEKSTESINAMVEVDGENYYLAKNNDIYLIRLEEGNKPQLRQKILFHADDYVKRLCYHQRSGRLIMVTAGKGIYIYDGKFSFEVFFEKLMADRIISDVKCLEGDEILVTTEGTGIYRMNVYTGEATPLITKEQAECKPVQADRVNDVFVDEQKRVWIAELSEGVTVWDKRFPSYKRRGLSGMPNNNVNAVLEDSDGDLWFATNDGIGCYEVDKGQWHPLLTAAQAEKYFPCSVYLSLCEVSPGVIWVSNCLHGIFSIYKKGWKARPVLSLENKRNLEDKFINCIYRASDGNVWAGGDEGLFCINSATTEMKFYKSIRSINTIFEKNADKMWIGSKNGLWQLDKQTGIMTKIELPYRNLIINCIYQDLTGLLYIGTSGNGLFVYNPKQGKFKNYTAENSHLVADDIYTLVPVGEEKLFMSTEKGLAWYDIRTKNFYNWTRDRGLRTDNFNERAGICRENGNLVFGTSNGAIEVNSRLVLPRETFRGIYLEDFRIFNHKVIPGEADSPLKKCLDDTDTLYLSTHHKFFSFKLNSPVYDYPSDILYSWILRGYDKLWRKADENRTVSYANLRPGEYQLTARAQSRETGRVVYQRDLAIIINPPFWRTGWAFLFYAVCILALIGWLFKYWSVVRKNDFSVAKINYLVRMANNMRMPLTLIKSPLEELNDKVPQEIKKDLSDIIYNVNGVTRQLNGLVKFKRLSFYADEPNITENELVSLLYEVLERVRPYASQADIEIILEKNFDYGSIWVDRECIEAVLESILFKVIDCTEKRKEIKITATYMPGEWSVSIATCYLKSIFNSRKLAYLRKVISINEGRFEVKEMEDGKRIFNLVFPTDVEFQHEGGPQWPGVRKTYPVLEQQAGKKCFSLLIVESNIAAGEYLNKCLAQEYNITVLKDGAQAWEQINKKRPDLIITATSVSGLQGYGLCNLLKTNIETASIPVILLSSLDTDEDYLRAKKEGADICIAIPFNIRRLKADIAMLINKREMLKKSYIKSMTGMELEERDGRAVCLKADGEFLLRVQTIIRENLSDPLFSVAFLCEKLKINRSTFYNKITSLTHQSPHAYIHKVKMEVAGELLRSNQYSTEEVADRAGFNDIKYFREVFKKYYGVSPKKYAKEKEV